jgi:hypothetical protein
MDTMKELLKSNIKKIFAEQYNKQIEVEYVSDIIKRKEEICEKDTKKGSFVYTGKYTGMFIPESDTHCTYILAEDERSDCDTIITIFHEFQHVKDYYWLLSLMDNNQDKMVNSSIYYTFQIYSEFMAEVFGINAFFDLCFKEKSKQEKVNIVLDAYKEAYKDYSNVHDKYEYIIHEIQHLAILDSCALYDDKFDLLGYIKDMDGFSKLKEIFNLLITSININLYWLQYFDKKCREFMQIG